MQTYTLNTNECLYTYVKCINHFHIPSAGPLHVVVYFEPVSDTYIHVHVCTPQI